MRGSFFALYTESVILLRIARLSKIVRTPIALAVTCLAALAGPAQATPAGTHAARDISAPAQLPARAKSGKQQPISRDLQEVLKKSTGLYHSMLGYLYLQGGQAQLAYAHLMSAAKLAPDALLYQQATEIALRERAPASALRALARWKADFPQDTKANIYHLQLLIASGRIEQTGDALQAALDAADADKKQAFIHAIPELYEGSRKPLAALAAAAPVLQKAMQQADTAFIAAASLARMQLAARLYPQALQSLQQSLSAKVPADKLGALPNRELPALIALDLMQASQAAAPDTAREAEAVVRKYMAQDPSRDFALVYTRVLMQARRLADAQQVLDSVLQKTPDFAAGWFIQSTLQMEAKQWQSAQASLQQYLKLRKAELLAPSAPAEAPAGEFSGTDASQQTTARDLQAYLMLARIADALNKPQEAQQWLERITPPPLNKQAQLQRLEWLVQNGQFNQALQQLPHLPAETPEEKTAVALLHSHVLEKQERYSQAMRVLNKALKTDPNNAELLYARGNIYWQLKKFAELEKDMRRVMQLQPDSAAAYNALGYYLADHNLRLNEAHALITRALELAPGNVAIQDSMGWVEYRLGNLPRALELLKQAFDTEPEAEIAAHYGEVLWKSGQQEEARKVWARGLELDAQHKVLLETMQRLTGQKPAAPKAPSSTTNPPANP